LIRLTSPIFRRSPPALFALSLSRPFREWHGHSFTLMGRGNVSTGKGAGCLTWTTPPLLGPLRGYVAAFSGYGESMIDYNWNQNSIGFGVTLNDTLDRF
jgi:phospholipase A1